MEEYSSKVLDQFKEVDKNGDGTLTRDEFIVLFKALDNKWSDRRLEKLFAAADIDQSGEVDVKEFLAWVFKKKGKKEKEAAPTVKEPESDAQLSRAGRYLTTGEVVEEDAESQTDESSDDEDEDEEEDDDDEARPTSSSSPSGRAAKAAAKPPKPRPKTKPVITTTAMYELLTVHDGVIGARLAIGDMCKLFAKARRGGLDSRLPRLLEQDPELGEKAATEGREALDITAQEVGHLYALMRLKPDFTLEDSVGMLEKLPPDMHDAEFTCLRDIGLDDEAAVGYKSFCQLIKLLSELMLIEQDQILAMLAWAHADSFELSEAMAKAVLMRVFLKAPSKKAALLQQSIQSNDFMRMCFVQDIMDKKGKNGMRHADLTLFFASLLRKMPELCERRDERKAGLKKKKKKKDKAKPAHKLRKGLAGRVKLSIMYEELWQAMPRGMYNSPLDLVLSMLEVADAAAVPMS